MSELMGIDREAYPIISIVVPVFNVEHTLKRCIDSILMQTFNRIEVILVDDGSTDRSGELCDQYIQQDNRVKVIHKKHGGLANARKTGLSVVAGDFVGFVDSDDYIEADTYNSMYLLTEDGTVDMIGCGCIMETKGKKPYLNINLATPGLYESESFERLKDHMMFDVEKGGPAVFQSVCCKIFRKKLLKEIIESVDGQITVGEDAAIVYPFLLRAKKIILSNDCFYHYVIHDYSMTHSKDTSIFEKIYRFQNYMKEYFKRYDVSYKLEMQLNWYLLHLIDMGTANLYGIRHKRVRCIHPTAKLDRGNIILYGAGTVGRRYYLDILKRGEVKVVSWVDKKYVGEEIYDRKIHAPEIIISSNFDYVLIAVADKKTAEEIKNEIKEFYNCERAVWFPGSFQYSGDVEFLNEL